MRSQPYTKAAHSAKNAMMTTTNAMSAMSVSWFGQYVDSLASTVPS
jgi:hypothetical protein